MAWIAEDRRSQSPDKPAQPYLTDELKKHLTEKYLPRYPTKRAVLLPALHLVQHTYNYIPTEALEEVAVFLELPPAEVLDTASFYEEYWLTPKGKYLIQVCRSLSCELCGSKQLTEHVKKKLNLQIGQTTADGKFTLIELECLGACGTAPVALLNDVLHENLTAEKLDQILDQTPADPHQYKDPTVDWDDSHES